MTARPRILAFDTSGPHCAANLFVSEHNWVWRKEEMVRGQAERLFPMLEEVLDEAKLGWGDLDALAVGVGPGNFTGIRIAVSAARGLSLSLGIPAIGVNLFEVRALGYFNLPGAHDRVLVCLMGPRDSLYVQLMGPEGALAPPRQIDPTTDALSDEEQRAVAVGPACNFIKHRLPVDTRQSSSVRSLSRTALIAENILASGDQIARPAPLYVRAADAAPASDPPPVILP